MATRCEDWLIGKDPGNDVGKDQRQEENGMPEDEIAERHPAFDGHDFEQTLGVSDGQEAWCAAVHWVAKSWTLLSD